jgi:hypothetical protein
MRKLLCVAAVFFGFLLAMTPTAEGAAVARSYHHYGHHYRGPRHHSYGGAPVRFDHR